VASCFAWRATLPKAYDAGIELLPGAFDTILVANVLPARRSASPLMGRGVTLAEMGELMLSLGAQDALNLDGGGSTVMARFKRSPRDFVLANRPSDGQQRPATQAFAAFAVRPSGP